MSESTSSRVVVSEMSKKFINGAVRKTLLDVIQKDVVLWNTTHNDEESSDECGGILDVL
jgi:hypothetical protein